MDVFRLIEEVRARPALWDFSHPDNKSRTAVPKMWQEVAKSLKVVDAEQCKRKWKNIRDTYNALLKRRNQQIEKAKELGVYNPQKDYGSKWLYFQSMEFLKNSGKRKRSTLDVEEGTEDDIQSHKDRRITMESIHISSDEEVDDNEDLEKENIQYTTQHQNTIDPKDLLHQLPPSTTIYSVTKEKTKNVASPKQPPPPPPPPPLQASQPSPPVLAEANNVNRPMRKPPSPPKSCKCANNVEFLENLEQQEQQLIKSTQEDIKRTECHINDPDYNFLISFLPQLKQMDDLQNLKFRSRLCDLVLDIMAPTVGPPPLQVNPAFLMQQQQQQQQERCNPNVLRANEMRRSVENRSNINRKSSTGF
ncbi:uncharacterized protein LOC142233475 isoform X2 [Haematobia irritans]|uniref:uncharacterized protein LOC142233475 isoform X2 n=1 Tax=Haematobia irritans TaxID=7368 RepID=UPI003F5059F8